MKKTIIITLVSLMVVGSAFVAFIFYKGHQLIEERDNSVKEQAVVTPQTPKQDPELKTYADKLGIDVSEINLSYKQIDNNAGFFTPPNTISIKPGMSNVETMGTISHEYLHYKYSTFNNDQKLQVKTIFEKIYNDEPDVKQLMDREYLSKGVSPDNFNDELQSNICEKLPTSRKTLEASSWCSNFVPNIAILFS